MDDLKTTLKKLDPINYKMLFLAFEKGRTKIIMLTKTRFIGVNAECIPNTVIVEKQGDFILGEFT